MEDHMNKHTAQLLETVAFLAFIAVCLYLM
jgi:hypothetical protein